MKTGEHGRRWSVRHRDVTVDVRRVRVLFGALLLTAIISSATASGAADPIGVVTEYAVPTANSSPDAITTGADGNLWFTELSANKVAKVTTSGTITEYPIPTTSSDPMATAPNGITAGPDGNLWIVEGNASKIAKVTTTGDVTEYPIPSGHGPYTITTGPDGNLWFTEIDGYVAKVTTTGTFTEYPTYRRRPAARSGSPQAPTATSGSPKIGRTRWPR